MTEKHIPSFLINLNESSERLEKVTQIFHKHDMKFTRVPAADGRKVDLKIASDCNFSKALKYYGRTLSGGEYGCYKSHLRCAQLIVEREHDYALVFEDDITLNEKFLTGVQAVIFQLKQKNIDWHLVNLGSPSVRIFTSIGKLETGQSLVAAHYFPQSAFAMLWSKAGARNFINNHSEVSMTVDNLFRHILIRSGKGFAVTPALAEHIDYGSTIDSSVKNKRYSNRRWNYGLLKQKRFWTNRAIALYRKLNYQEK